MESNKFAAGVTATMVLYYLYTFILYQSINFLRLVFVLMGVVLDGRGLTNFEYREISKNKKKLEL